MPTAASTAWWWAQLNVLAGDGLVNLQLEHGRDRVQVTSAGRWLIRSIAAVFDPSQRQCASGSRLL